MSASTTVTAIKNHLADLGMPGSLEVVDNLMTQLDQGALSAGEAMEKLLEAQVGLRRERRLYSAMHVQEMTFGNC